MSLRLRLLVSALILPAAPVVRAQTEAPPTPAATSATVPGAVTGAPVPPLTLDECIARALDRNFDLQIQRLTTSQARDNVEIARAGFDPTLELTGRKSVNQQAAATSTLDGVTTDGPRQEAESLRAGASQRVTTGGSLEISTALDKNESNSRNAILNPAYDGDVSLSVRQPLLRGAGTGVNRAAIRRAEIGVDRANFDLKGAVLDVVQSVESAYYNLAFAREQLTVRRLSLQLAEQLLEENRARRQTGVATDLDVLQAEVGVANARRGVLLAEQTVKDREDALLNLIGQFEFDRPIGSVSFSFADVPAVSFDASYQLARENDPFLASTAASIRQLEIDVRTAKNNRLPNLDVGGAAGYNSRESSYSEASRRVWDGEGYSWQVDLTLSVPWGFREEKARYRQALVSVNREEARLRQLDQNLVVQVRSAVRSVETNRASVEISALATQLSEQQYQLERARFDAGLSTSRRVLEAQDDLETARVNELQSRVNLRIALSQLQRLEASSLPRYNIQIVEER